ncbi:hypothetical protein GCM10010381_04800 [Streptomyces xantholiticus]|nr:hypothetical protein GCM10010381_04800 [Streptomyces xantholiticus]
MELPEDAGCGRARSARLLTPARYLALRREVGRAMRDASIRGLGQTAWNAVESAIDRLGAYG